MGHGKSSKSSKGKWDPMKKISDAWTGEWKKIGDEATSVFTYLMYALVIFGMLFWVLPMVIGYFTVTNRGVQQTALGAWNSPTTSSAIRGAALA